MKLRHLSAALLAAAVGGAALAKLPPPTPAEQAKAEELKAKAAWTAKVSAYQLCQVQDRVAAKFGQGKSVAKPPGAAQPPAATSSAPKAAAASPAASATGTPVASAPPAPCIEPGPFAYTPAAEKPLEASGAHSPPGTAATPPSVRPEQAEMKPGTPAPAPGNKS